MSGALAGLLRVRMLSMNDAHIYCTLDQVGKKLLVISKWFKIIILHLDLKTIISDFPFGTLKILKNILISQKTGTPRRII